MSEQQDPDSPLRPTSAQLVQHFTRMLAGIMLFNMIASFFFTGIGYTLYQVQLFIGLVVISRGFLRLQTNIILAAQTFRQVILLLFFSLIWPVADFLIREKEQNMK